MGIPRQRGAVGHPFTGDIGEVCTEPARAEAARQTEGAASTSPWQAAQGTDTLDRPAAKRLLEDILAQTVLPELIEQAHKKSVY